MLESIVLEMERALGTNLDHRHQKSHVNGVHITSIPYGWKPIKYLPILNYKLKLFLHFSLPMMCC